MSPLAPLPETARRRPPRRLRWIVLVAAVLASPLLAEAWLRFLLFSDSDLAHRLGAELRQPNRFADPELQDEYWRLRRRLGTYAGDLPEPPHFHPELGWINGAIQPVELGHLQRRQVAGRRPVLLYGASFATSAYAALLDASDLGEEHALLPYGVGGYGIDQVYLLLRGSLDGFAGEDPIVVIGLKADGDFERCGLSVRPWPKPRFRVDASGTLFRPDPRVAEAGTYFDEHPIGIRSYLWNHLLRDDGFLPRSWRARLSGAEERRRETRELIAALVRAIDVEATSRGLRYGYLLFCGIETALGSEAGLASERWLVDLLDREGIPYVLVRSALLSAAEEHGERIEDYYFPPGHESFHHPSPLGLQRSFPSLRRVVLGDFDGP